MANIQSARKRAKQALKHRQQNYVWKKTLHQEKRALEEAIKNKDGVGQVFTRLQKIIDKAAKNKVLHPQKAARLKARLAKKLDS